MPSGDHCVVSGCDNDRRYSEKQTVLPHVGILRFCSPRNNKDVLSWAGAINPDQFNWPVSMSTMACSNHFVRGYRNSEIMSYTNFVR